MVPGGLSMPSFGGGGVLSSEEKRARERRRLPAHQFNYELVAPEVGGRGIAALRSGRDMAGLSCS